MKILTVFLYIFLNNIHKNYLNTLLENEKYFGQFNMIFIKVLPSKEYHQEARSKYKIYNKIIITSIKFENKIVTPQSLNIGSIILIRLNMNRLKNIINEHKYRNFES